MTSITLNKGEYGQKVYVNLGQDISTNIGFNFYLEPQIGELLTKTSTDGVAVGTVNMVVDGETFIANEYLEYTIKDGDLSYAGLWRLRGDVSISTSLKVIGDYAFLTVLE
jgi:hypothetical protein